MSVPRGYLQNGRAIYANVTNLKSCGLNFIVDAANGNGLGIRSLKSNGYVESVFMHTSATPGSYNGFLNPNPAAGYMQIRFKNNFNYYLGGFSGFVAPVTGSALTSTTAGLVYVIVSLGTTTLAQWQAAGFPLGFTPVVGAAFVAIATGAIGGTGAVEVPGTSGMTSIEAVGDPNALLNNSLISRNAGAVLTFQFMGATSSSVTTLIPSAPATNSVVGMTFWFDGSTVGVPDQPGQTGI